MPLLIVVIYVGAFLAIAPGFMKKLVLADIALSIFLFIVLRVAALILGAARSGRNAGMLSDHAMWLLMLVFSIPALMAVGIVLGSVAGCVKRHRRKKQLQQAA